MDKLLPRGAFYSYIHFVPLFFNNVYFDWHTPGSLQAYIQNLSPTQIPACDSLELLFFNIFVFVDL